MEPGRNRKPASMVQSQSERQTGMKESEGIKSQIIHIMIHQPESMGKIMKGFKQGKGQGQLWTAPGLTQKELPHLRG